MRLLRLGLFSLLAALLVFNSVSCAEELGDSTITLSATAEVELTVSSEHKVLTLTALNAEAEEMLSGESLVGAELKAAVGRIITLMNEKGYLSSDAHMNMKNEVVITVSGGDETSVESALRQKIESTLKSLKISGSVRRAKA